MLFSLVPSKASAPAWLTNTHQQTDWDAVAKQSGYKDAKNAKIMFGRFKDKLVKGAGGSDAAPSGGVDKSSPSKKAAGRPKKAGVGDEGSPKKGGQAKSAKAKAVVEEEEDEDEEVDEELEDGEIKRED